MTPTAQVYADTENNVVAVTLSGGVWVDPVTGEETVIEPTEITLAPATAREFAFRLTEASLKLEDHSRE